MTSTFTTRASRPLSGEQAKGRVLRSMAYDVLLVPVGGLAMVEAAAGREDEAHWRWRRLARFQRSPELVRLRRPGAVSGFGHGLLSRLLGLLSWFLVMLLVTAVVRGPFYGFVEDGPFGPGTWGGPTKAGAWAAHAGISVPIIVVIPLVLRGIGLLQAAVVRRMYGMPTGRWVLPATITVGVAGLVLFTSWLRQL